MPLISDIYVCLHTCTYPIAVGAGVQAILDPRPPRRTSILTVRLSNLLFHHLVGLMPRVSAFKSALWAPPIVLPMCLLSLSSGASIDTNERNLAPHVSETRHTTYYCSASQSRLARQYTKEIQPGKHNDRCLACHVGASPHK